MKIDFSGSFTEVIRHVQERVKKEESPSSDFGEVLADVSKAHITTQKSSFLPKEATPKLYESYASLSKFDFAEPAIDPPTITPLMITETAKASVNISSLEVKAPTLVEAERIPAQKSIPISKQDKVAMRELVEDAGHKLGIDPALSLAVAKAESSFNPRAVSSDGHASKGLFQLLDSTGLGLHNKLEMRGRYDPFNPTMNAQLGVNYLRYLHDIFSKETPLPNSLSTAPAANSTSLEKLAVAAFNAGEGRVAGAQARSKSMGKNPGEYHDVEQYLPESTQDYVQRVLEFRSSFEEQE